MPNGYNLSKMFIEYCNFIQSFQDDKEVIDINSNQRYVLKPPNVPVEQLAIVNPLTGKIMS